MTKRATEVASTVEDSALAGMVAVNGEAPDPFRRYELEVWASTVPALSYSMRERERPLQEPSMSPRVTLDSVNALVA